MKKLTRLGALLFVAGISLLLVTVFRGSSSFIGTHMYDIPSVGWSIPHPQLWPPRSLRLEVTSESEIDIFILDEQGINLWNEEETLRPLFTFNQVKHDVYTVQLSRRGKYAFLIHNPSSSDNERTTVELITTFYWFENDLLLASIAVTITGAIITTASKIISR